METACEPVRIVLPRPRHPVGRQTDLCDVRHVDAYTKVLSDPQSFAQHVSGRSTGNQYQKWIMQRNDGKDLDKAAAIGHVIICTGNCGGYARVRAGLLYYLRCRYQSGMGGEATVGKPH